MFLRDVSLLAPLGVSLAFLVWNVLSLNDLGSASYFHRMWQLRRMRLPAPTSPRKHRDTKLVLRHHVSQKKFPKAPAVWECTLEGLTHSRDWWGGGGYIGRGPWDSAGRRGPTPAKRHFIKLGNMEALVGEMVSLFLA